MGMFDDLIPQQAAGPAAPVPPPAGMFDDLIPKGAPQPSANPGEDTFRQQFPRGLIVHGNTPTPRPAPAQPPPGPVLAQGTPSPLESAATGAAQGLTLNWAPDIHGLVMAGGGDGQTPGSPLMGAVKLVGESLLPSVFGNSATDQYSQGVADARAAADAAQKANPGSYLAGELAGGVGGAAVLPAMAPFRAAEGAGIVGRAIPEAGNLLTGGATYGGIAGAGGAEGGIEDRLAGAARGAEMGALLAPAIGAGMSGAGKALGAPISHLKATFNPQAVADRVLGRSLASDSTDIQDAANTIQAAIAQGQPLTLADVAGPNTQGVVGSVARFPGPARSQAREFLGTRQIGDDTTPSQFDRISGQLGHLVGSDAGSLETAEQIMANREAQAAPIYRASENVPIKYGSTAGQNLKASLDRVPEGILGRANQIIKVSDEGGHQLVLGPDGKLQALPNVRQWRYIRRGLDDAIEGERDAQTGSLSQYGRALSMLRKEIGDNLGKASPLTAKADTIYAGESRLLGALRDGKKAFLPSTTAESLEAQISALSPGEAEMFRLGAANALREKMAGAGDGINKARIAYGSPANRAKISALAPDGASRARFDAFLKNESGMFSTAAKATGNSATAERLGDDAEMIGKIQDGLHLGGALLSGKPGAIISAVARHMAKVDPAKRGAVLSAIRDIALNPNPDTVRAFAARIQATPMRSNVRRNVVGAVMRGLTQSTLTIATQRTGGATGAQSQP